MPERRRRVSLETRARAFITRFHVQILQLNARATGHLLNVRKLKNCGLRRI